MKYIALFISSLLFATSANAAVEVGKLAPNFTATTMNGESVSLDQYRGKNVVLEWNNPECPFVVKFYKNGNMQALQKAATDDGVVWLSINSGAEGKQGHLTPEQAIANFADKKSAASEYILDADGTIGRMYDAKTTPHMFVINAEGILVYAGAIDSINSFDPADIEKADNYVTMALASLKAGTPIETASTQSYGCSVKYKN